MSARFENELRIKSKIEQKLNNYPEYLYEWYLSLCASGKQATTIRDFVNKICLFLQSISSDTKNIDIAEINYKNLNTYYISKQSSKSGKKSSDSYMCSLWSVFNNFLIFLNKRHYISENYMEMIERPKNHDLDRINKNRILLQEDDFNAILESVNNGCGSSKAKSFQEKMKNRDMTILLFFMNTGMRKEALREINLSDIDLDDNRMTIIDKGGKMNIYPMNSLIISYLNLWLSDREKYAKDDALFITTEGNRMCGNSIYNLVVKYCDDALGEHISPHKLRSGFCSIMYKQTGDAEKVRRMVGHSNIQTTLRYIKTDDKEREEAAYIMESLLTI